MRALRIKINIDLLAASLGFPEDLEIWEVRTPEVGVLEMKVRSDRFKEQKPGAIIPLADPKITESVSEEGVREIIWVWPTGFLEDEDDGVSGTGPRESRGDLPNIEQGGSDSPGEDAG